MAENREYACKTCGTRHPPPTGRRCRFATPESNDREQDQEDAPPSEHSDLDSLEVDNEHTTDNPGDVVVGAISKVAEQMENIAQRLERALGAASVVDQPVALPLPRNSAQSVPQPTASQDPEPPQATPSSLRADEDLMVRVARRLRELGDDEQDDSAHGATAAPLTTKKGKRSGQVRTVEDIVIREVDWPHLNVYRGAARRPVKYGDMTVTEFVYGYLQMIHNPRNRFDKDVMMGILRNIMEDALTYPWDNVRNFYRVLSSMVEMDRVQWTDTEQISTLRYHYAHRPSNMYRAQQATPSGRQNGESIKTCAAYQRGECTETGDHAGLLHACVFCARVKQTAYPHAEKDCRRKKFMQSKNANGGEN